MSIIPYIFWGSTVLSICVSIAGVLTRRPWLLVAGAVLACPLAFYVGASPMFKIWAFFLPVLQLGAAGVVRRSVLLATALLIPFVSLAVWVAIVVIR